MNRPTYENTDCLNHYLDSVIVYMDWLEAQAGVPTPCPECGLLTTVPCVASFEVPDSDREYRLCCDWCGYRATNKANSQADAYKQAYANVEGNKP